MAGRRSRHRLLDKRKLLGSAHAVRRANGAVQRLQFQSEHVQRAEYDDLGGGLATLWCPSDPKVADLYTYPPGAVGTLPATSLPMHFTSYGANSGEFFNFDQTNATILPNCQASADAAPGEQQMNGIVYYLSHVNLSGVTDGTSNTFAFAERGHGRFPASDVNCWNWWTSGNYGDTMFNTFYGMNVWFKPPFNVNLGPVSAATPAPTNLSPRRAASILVVRTSASATARSSSSRTRPRVGRSIRPRLVLLVQ